MNLCIVSSGDFFSNYGGGQVYVRNIVDEFAKRPDIQLFIVSRCLKNRVADYRGIPVFEYADTDSLHKILTAKRPDVVHANGDKLTVSRVCKTLGIPCVVTVHHGGIVCPAGTLLNTNDEVCQIQANYQNCLKCYLRNTPTGLFWYPLLHNLSQKKYVCLGKRLKKLPFVPFLSPIGETGLIVSEKIKEWKELADKATRFIAPSNAISDALIRNCCPSSKVTVLPHGIPQNTVSSNSSIINYQLSTINFYYVGRINYVKGIHVLLESFSYIDNPNIRLHLIGGAGNKTETRYMKRLQKKYHGDHRIIWHGKIPSEKMEDVIKDFHCLVHPAIYLEVFGLNISEALAQHIYVIATRCGGAEMQIHYESEGQLVDPNDANALKDAIIQYASNPKQSNASVIDIETHVKQLYDFYCSIQMLQTTDISK